MQELTGRRAFVGVMTKAAGASLLMPPFELSGETRSQPPSVTVGQVIDLILKIDSECSIPQNGRYAKSRQFIPNRNGYCGHHVCYS